MDTRNTDRADEVPMGETPEDVAVLYSWANLHGAKYRDFSASRREYRAQLRHRAAEQAREQELRAQADAEASASIAEGTARQAEQAVRLSPTRQDNDARQQARREAEEAARVANAERIEAARRAEAAALAEAAARREEREIAEAGASARRQAARYADSEIRTRANTLLDDEADIPGQITDPYTPQVPQSTASLRSITPQPRAPEPVHIAPKAQPQRTPDPLPPIPMSAAVAPAPLSRQPLRSFAEDAPDLWEEAPPIPIATAPARRPRGYRPDDASGVRQIYRGPEAPQSRQQEPLRQVVPVRTRTSPDPVDHLPVAAPRYNTAQNPPPAQPHLQAGAGDPTATWTSTSQNEPSPQRPPLWSEPIAAPSSARRQTSAPPPAPSSPALPMPYTPGRVPAARTEAPSYPNSTTPGSLEDPGQRRRRQDFLPPYIPGTNTPVPTTSTTPASPSFPQRPSLERNPAGYEPAPRPSMPTTPTPPAPAPAPPQEATAPAWLYSSQSTQATSLPYRAPTAPAASQPSVADTLQHSRERVASRWYALKGVFEQPGQEGAEAQPVRQKETRTPVLAIFSLAGGVGKTSLVATLGRSLSSLGEKVLLTDTTSHGLLPFYFGASELRQGTVRTFSPPSGSTDAPIYLVSYDVDAYSGDEAAQDGLIDEITHASRGTHRVLLDLSVSSGWVARRMARHKPTILVPVAPDMNSVISLQAVDKFFSGISDPEGKPLQIFYVLNQFDASLPLHLDVREVLRRQLGERLLPTVIRRAPAVSEALAEGMTIVDYSPEAPVAEDYLGIATWLRTLAAPATAGFRNVRWSER